MERCLSYDRNGNLLTMVRYENGEEQCNFSYTYDGNCLKSYLTDKIIDLEPGDHEIIPIPRSIPPFIIETPLPMYEYDANGNIVEDYIRGFDLSYNQLNLLENVTSDNATVANYSYLWDGTKLSAKTGEGTGFAYRGSFTYHCGEDFPTIEAFESTTFGGGRIVTTEGNPEVHYFLTDHLGNTRVVAKVTSMGRVDLDRKDYYPFGRAWTQSDMPTSSNRYLFSGKEQQYYPDYTDDYYDFGARFYHPDTGIWLQQDPILQFPSLYTYCADNPINFIDPFGLDVWTTNDPALIAQFIDDYTKTGNINTSSGWKYFTDEEFFNQNSETTPYIRKDNRGNYYFTYNTIENGTVVVNTMKLSRLSPFTSFNGDLDNLAWWKEQFNNTVAWTSIVALQLKHYSGITRIGSNGKLYFKTAKGRVFYGNKYVTTKSLAKIGADASQVLGTVGWILRISDAYQDAQNGETYKAAARMSYGALTDVSVRIPYAGPAVAIGMIIIEAKWGEEMYDYVQEFFE